MSNPEKHFDLIFDHKENNALVACGIPQDIYTITAKIADGISKQINKDGKSFCVSEIVEATLDTIMDKFPKPNPYIAALFVQLGQFRQRSVATEIMKEQLDDIISDLKESDTSIPKQKIS